MTKVINAVSTMLIGLCIAGCDTSHPSNFRTHNEQRFYDGPLTGLEGYSISKKGFPTLEMEALTGSGEAAVRIGNYHQFWTTDITKAIFWYEIAAENGSYAGMYNLALILNVYADPEDENSKTRARARFWYKKVIESGPPEIAIWAKDALRLIDEERDKRRAKKGKS